MLSLKQIYLESIARTGENIIQVVQPTEQYVITILWDQPRKQIVFSPPPKKVETYITMLKQRFSTVRRTKKRPEDGAYEIEFDPTQDRVELADFIEQMVDKDVAPAE